MKNELKHTAHSSYRCEYHVVFAPKYRRKVIYNEIKKDIGEILRKLCSEMKVEIIEAEACPDHIHMLVSIPPYMSVAQFMGTLKSKSALHPKSSTMHVFGEEAGQSTEQMSLFCGPMSRNRAK